MDQVRERRGNPDALVAAIVTELSAAFGENPSTVPLQAIAFEATRPQ